MPGCCALPHDANPPACPKNGEATKPVGRKTLDSLLTAEAKLSLLPQPYYFCAAPDCDVVYVSALADHLFTKDQLTVRVGVKEKDDPVPLCYCFSYERATIRADIIAGGETDIPKRIAARVKAGECRCEETNPSSTCCLGSIYRAIQEAKALKAAGVLHGAPERKEPIWYVCVNCDHTFIPTSFELHFGAHCPRCRSTQVVPDDQSIVTGG